jgi:hypothetical protein
MRPRKHSSERSRAHRSGLADYVREQLEQPCTQSAEMSQGRIFLGQLKGNGHSATCTVRVGADGGGYIADVTPSLPDGDYDLLVNRIFLRVRHADGYWSLITE